MILACALGIVLADQGSKKAIQARGVLSLAMLQFRCAIHREEYFERTAARVALVLTLLSALICAVVLSRSGLWFQSAASVAGLGLALGGAASNLLDILRLRYVVNFIDLGWWPVFNLADVAIVAGLGTAFLF